MSEFSESLSLAETAALHQARRAVSQFPDRGERLSNLANQLRLSGQPADALSWIRWAVHPEAWPNKRVDPRAFRVQAEVMIDLGLFAEADHAYGLSDPERCSPLVQWSRSRALIGLGDWSNAWPLAELRFQLATLPEVAFPLPHWQGWPRVTRVVVWDEQGFGDSLQALRWLPVALQQVGHITVYVRPPMVRLLRVGLSWLGQRLIVGSRDEIRREIIQDSCHGSLLSFPTRLGCKKLSPGHVLRLPVSLTGFSRRHSIGLVWESGRYLNDPHQALEYRRKSLPPDVRERLKVALESRGFVLLSLQLGDSVVPHGADFLQQAQALFNCHLLLTVDTAAAHLAGALDFPAWLMLPWSSDSRWQRGRSTTPLYRSLKLFRQPRPGDWDGMLQSLLKQFDQVRSEGTWLR